MFNAETVSEAIALFVRRDANFPAPAINYGLWRLNGDIYPAKPRRHFHDCNNMMAMMSEVCVMGNEASWGHRRNVFGDANVTTHLQQPVEYHNSVLATYRACRQALQRRAQPVRGGMSSTHTLLRPVRSKTVAFARRSIGHNSPRKYGALALSTTGRKGGLPAWRNTPYLALRYTHGSCLAVPICVTSLSTRLALSLRTAFTHTWAGQPTSAAKQIGGVARLPPCPSSWRSGVLAAVNPAPSSRSIVKPALEEWQSRRLAWRTSHDSEHTSN
jgi:hypothetical protein